MSFIMCNVAIMLSCLACISLGRRTQTASLSWRAPHRAAQEVVDDAASSHSLPGLRQSLPSERSEVRDSEALSSLARLLLAQQPAAAWQAGGAGVRQPFRSHVRRAATVPRLQAEDLPFPGMPTSTVAEKVLRVNPPDCESCEKVWLDRTKEAELNESARLHAVHSQNISQIVDEVWFYAKCMNDSMRQGLSLIPDLELRTFILKSSTGVTPVMNKMYNATMRRVPYEAACYICAPEQAQLLRTLVGLARPRKCLDIGSFTGYSSAAILDAIPEDAEVTALDIDRDYSRLAAEQLAGRNVNFMVGPAIDTLRSFEEKGEQFDFICLDADKPMHGEYYNASLKILRPGGLIIMFGMLLFPTAEDQVAMEKLHGILPNDTRISTAQLPLGCGIQVMVKLEGMSPDKVLSDEEKAQRKRWELESELAAIDRYISSLDNSGPDELESTGQAPSSIALVAQASAYREYEAALIAAQAEADGVVVDEAETAGVADPVA